LPNDGTKQVSTTINPGKTVWDWASLVGVPLSLFALGHWVQRTQQQQAIVSASEQRRLAEAAEKEAILQNYLDKMSTLLLSEQLVLFSAEANITDEQQQKKKVALSIIHARTLSILRRFESDGEMKASIIWFLKRARVTTDLAVSLSEADLSGAYLDGIFLAKAILTGANFNKAHLVNAFFRDTELSNADFRDAHCHYADFRDATLNKADFTRANMKEVDLFNAKLHGTKLIEAKLNDAELSGAELSNADLTRAVLTGANLEKVKSLYRAELSGIEFDFNTKWPRREIIAKARNIPEQLKQHYGIR